MKNKSGTKTCNRRKEPLGRNPLSMLALAGHKNCKIIFCFVIGVGIVMSGKGLLPRVCFTFTPSPLLHWLPMSPSRLKSLCYCHMLSCCLSFDVLLVFPITF